MNFDEALAKALSPPVHTCRQPPPRSKSIFLATEEVVLEARQSSNTKAGVASKERGGMQHAWDATTRIERHLPQELGLSVRKEKAESAETADCERNQRNRRLQRNRQLRHNHQLRRNHRLSAHGVIIPDSSFRWHGFPGELSVI